MATIFYGVSGEGRGHATRVRAVVEDLRHEHRVIIYAPAMAYSLLSQTYQHTEVVVRRIPGFCFHYTQARTLNYWKTGWYAASTLAQFPNLLRRLRQDMEREQPDLVITDFEPSLPWAAQQCGLPFISLNHQHFLVAYDLRSLPWFLQLQAALMAQFVKLFYSRQIQTIVSSFYFPPLKPQYRNVEQIGVLLRPEIVQAAPENGSHLVAYLRRTMPPEVSQALAECGLEVHIYGLGARPAEGQLKFLEIDVFRFVEDLATSRALISTAGNQLVGEALFLGKPVLAMPEPGNYEQEINAHFLQQSGGGLALNMPQLTARHIHRFLDRFQDIRHAINRTRLYGNPAALRIITRHLPNVAPPAAKPRLHEVFA